MSKQYKRSKSEIPTIDCSLITVEYGSGEFGLDTSNKVAVDPQIEEEDAVKLVIKGVLRAQKPKQSAITGHEITLTDNVFNPQLVMALQGGSVIYDDAGNIASYTPPAVGTKPVIGTFTLNCYSAQYDASGSIVKYEKISYPNCKGTPIAFGSEDGVFRAPEYKITSAPNKGEPPYVITYSQSLPILVDEYDIGDLTVNSVIGGSTGKTHITVSPVKDSFLNKYYYKLFTVQGDAVLPLYGAQMLTTDGWILWDGLLDITADADSYIVVVETDDNNRALLAGKIKVVTAA